MNIAVIIPDRNDRPEFTRFCLEKLNRQTLKPSQIIHVNEPPKSQKPDITYRYRTGYNKVNSDIDLVALIENDDWYSDTYLEDSLNTWIGVGKPDILGRNKTVYYNLNVKGYFTMNHTTRSSAMNTLLKPRLKINWCVDHEVYTDLHLWMNQPHLRKAIIEQPLNCIGMKHGVGLCGGRNHTDYLHRYINKDEDMQWLKANVDQHSYKFYSNIKR